MEKNLETLLRDFLVAKKNKLTNDQQYQEGEVFYLNQKPIKNKFAQKHQGVLKTDLNRVFIIKILPYIENEQQMLFFVMEEDKMIKHQERTFILIEKHIELLRDLTNKTKKEFQFLLSLIKQFEFKNLMNKDMVFNCFLGFNKCLCLNYFVHNRFLDVPSASTEFQINNLFKYFIQILEKQPYLRLKYFIYNESQIIHQDYQKILVVLFNLLELIYKQKILTNKNGISPISLNLMNIQANFFDVQIIIPGLEFDNKLLELFRKIKLTCQENQRGTAYSQILGVAVKMQSISHIDLTDGICQALNHHFLAQLGPYNRYGIEVLATGEIQFKLTFYTDLQNIKIQ